MRRTTTPTQEEYQQGVLISTCVDTKAPLAVTHLQLLDDEILLQNPQTGIWLNFGGSPPTIKQQSSIDQKIDSIAVSADSKRIITYQSQPDQQKPDHSSFIVTSPDGHNDIIEVDLSDISNYVRKEIAPTYSFQKWSIRWVTDQIVRIDTSYSETLSMDFPIHQYAFYNINQKAWWNSNINEIPNREPYGWVDIAPNQEYVLYISDDDHLVLWDREKQDILWINDKLVSSNPTPFESQWSPDSQYVAFGGFINIQVLTINSRVIQTIISPESSRKALKFYFDRTFKWSPDSQLLAFTGAIQDSTVKVWEPVLYVYDLKRDSFIYQCDIGNKDIGKPFSQITWSPDGDYLAPMGIRSPSIYLRIYDIKTLQIYQFENEDLILQEWLEFNFGKNN